MIEKYAKYVEEERNFLELDDLDQLHVKMLADVIESIIGAILLDSFDIQATEKAWLHLCESYLKEFADRPKSPPKRNFMKYCEETVFLKDFKDGTMEIAIIPKEQLKENYNIEYGNSVMKYDFKYKAMVVFTRYYENSVKSKDKRFYKELLEATKTFLGKPFSKIIKSKQSYRLSYHREIQDLQDNDIDIKKVQRNILSEPYTYSNLEEKKSSEQVDGEDEGIIMSKRMSTSSHKTDNKSSIESPWYTNLTADELKEVGKYEPGLKDKDQTKFDILLEFDEWMKDYFYNSDSRKILIQDIQEFASSLKENKI